MPRLTQLLNQAGLPGRVDSDPEAIGISEDSREVEPGYVFVAIPGTHESGVRYVADAVSRGAVAVISEEPTEADVPVVLAPNARAALADLAAAFYGFPSHDLTALGVTGTDGKSTTCFLLASILRTAGFSTGMMTTVETRVGGNVVLRKDRLTTPSAPFVQRTLREMVDAGDGHAVVECSSHGLALNRLRGVVLHAAAITNVASDHIAFHGSQDEYLRVKASIADLVQGGSDIAELVVNQDDAGARKAAKIAGRGTLTFGIESEADLRAEAIETSLEGTSFTVTWKEWRHDAWMPLPGRFNVYNALAAIGLALTVSLDLETSIAGLRDPLVPIGRMQRIDEGQPFSFYVDFAHTEQSFPQVIGLLAEAADRAGGGLIAVFGAAGEHDREKRPKMGAIAAEYCRFFVITDEDPYFEDPQVIAEEIGAGASIDGRGRQWVIELDRRRAIELAVEKAKPNDVVVVVGKGHEASIVRQGVAHPWSDIETAREALRSVVARS